jgi:hypothetical protein
MLKETIKSTLSTARSLLQGWHALAIFAGLYALLLATLYGFIATREATIGQVLLTLLFAACAPVIFFLLQATIINRVRRGRIEWYRGLRDSCKLALLALPVILAGFAIAALLNRWQAHFPAPHVSPLSVHLFGDYPAPPQATNAVMRQPMHWPTFLFSTLRCLLFGIALPLTMIQLWVEMGNRDLLKLVRGGARSILSKLAGVMSRAFAPQSVLIYSLGLIVFVVLPYVLLFVHTPLKGARSEIGIFTTRLALVFVFTLLGWVITLSTFARSSERLVIENQEPQPEESA